MLLTSPFISLGVEGKLFLTLEERFEDYSMADIEWYTGALFIGTPELCSLSTGGGCEMRSIASDFHYVMHTYVYTMVRLLTHPIFSCMYNVHIYI